jgi:hypothetical protein
MADVGVLRTLAIVACTVTGTLAIGAGPAAAAPGGSATAWLGCEDRPTGTSASTVTAHQQFSGLNPAVGYLFEATHDNAGVTIQFGDGSAWGPDQSGAYAVTRSYVLEGPAGTATPSTSVGDGYTWNLWEVNGSETIVASGLLTIGPKQGCPSVTLTQKPPVFSNATTASFGFSPVGATAVTCRWDDFYNVTPCTTGVTRTGLTNGPHTFDVAVSNALGGQDITYSWTVDTYPPWVYLTSATAPFTLASSATVSWTGNDSGTGSGLAYYQLRSRHAAWNGGFSAWSAGAHLSPSTTHLNVEQSTAPVTAQPGQRSGAQRCRSMTTTWRQRPPAGRAWPVAFTTAAPTPRQRTSARCCPSPAPSSTGSRWS